MAVGVYVLCMLTSAFCAVLLLREYRSTRVRLLLWSSVSFVGWALNNALVFTDLVVLPAVDLSVVRAAVACGAVSCLVYGLTGMGRDGARHLPARGSGDGLRGGRAVLPAVLAPVA
jgi:hypothetical protein